MSLISPRPIAANSGSRLALASLLLGLSAYFLLLGPLTGLPAIICGHKALTADRRKPLRPSRYRMAVAGLVAGYASLIVFAGILVVLALHVTRKALPAVMAPANQVLASACVENLAAIDLAKELWALERRASDGASVSWAAGLSGVVPLAQQRCPAGGAYEVGAVGSLPTCSVGGHELPVDTARDESDPDGVFSSEFFQRIQPRLPAMPNTNYFLASLPPETIPDYSLAELESRWRIFTHADYAETGFNHLVLPFATIREGASGATSNGFAFAFLLSWALDWTPGAYNNRHGYFVFKRAGAPIVRAARTRDKLRIQNLNKHWQATHAIGGQLLEGPQGYGAVVQVYDRSGRLLKERRYEPNQGFLDLVADVTFTSLLDLGYRPDLRLKEHLRAPVYKHPESILDLSAAAFAEERSGDEFGLYRRILERDPTFAEVRYWIANQGQWQHDNQGSFQAQQWQALTDHIMPTALGSLSLEGLGSAAERTQFEAILNRVQILAGSDSPLLVQQRMRYRRRWGGGLTTADYRGALATAARYPNEGFLLQTLAQFTAEDPAGPRDGALGAALALAGMRSLDTENVSSQRWRAYYFGRFAAELGYHHHAARVLLPLAQWAAAEQTENFGYYVESALLSLSELGWYSEAAELALFAYRQSGDRGAPEFRSSFAAYAANCAALAERQDLLVEVDKNPNAPSWPNANRVFNNRALFATLEVPSPYQMRKIHALLVAGQTAEAERVLGDGPFVSTPFNVEQNAWAMPIVTQLDLDKRRTTHRGQVAAALALQPNLRSLWRSYDQYDRMAVSSDAEAFYSYLEWLHPDDPWANAAVVARRQRIRATPVDAAPVVRALQGYAPMPWPHVGPVSPNVGTDTVFLRLPPLAVVAAVRTLVDQQDYAAARTLLEHAYAAAHKDDLGRLMSQFNYLHHIVTAASAGRSAIIGVAKQQ